MAYKATISGDPEYYLYGEIVSHFWAVHKSVGWGCPNKSDDVLLVQYLVNVWAKEEALETDGLFGNKTYQGIKSFQKWMNRYCGFNCVKTDGKVSATDGDNYVNKSGDFYYTIHCLNRVYLEERRIYYNDLRMDRLLPAGLCHILSKEA